MYFYKVVGIGLIEAQELEQYKFRSLFFFNTKISF